MTDELKKLRDAIDKIDNELLELISKRASLASNIGSLKTDGVIYRPEREAQVLRRLVEQNQGHFPMKVSKVSIRALCLIVGR